jgi:hypothetical protein
VRRIGRDSVVVHSGRGPVLRARVDAAGRILEVRTPGATPLTVTRVADVDVAGLAARWAKPAAGTR